jgi:transposase
MKRSIACVRGANQRHQLLCPIHKGQFNLASLHLRDQSAAAARDAMPPKTFESRVRTLVADHPTLLAVADALLRARAMLAEQFIKLDKQTHSVAGGDNRARLLTTVPGVGSIVALTFASAIDDPGRFKSSKTVGALFGLTPKKYQSGETDVTGRISKIGDAGVRTALYEAANVILTRTRKGSSLKKWAMGVAKRAGMRKAKVALARKLAVVMHRMLVDGTPFVAQKTAMKA